ncbi:hypothetical protein BJF79_08315 [Actinomadura sp. CNU-125]|uniref:hypothetical protein n=1 Tax=Actinomadura sp. CNU-125 TaxID=1904961 RepID=UPI00096996E6|nr:hypothetical protein [Actinomadura sp. CNU-125]OLT32557.1 hypothetical protein BJF79_08315 [Actinomadura sp. CNU-125]
MLTALAVRLRRAAHPLLAPGMVTDRAFWPAAIAAATGFFALMGVLFLLTRYLQEQRGFTPTETALALLPVPPPSSAGNAATVNAASTAMLRAAPAGRSGSAAAVNETAFKLGGALGVAVLGGAAFDRAASSPRARRSPSHC